MERKILITVIAILLTVFLSFSSANATISCTNTESTKTIAVGETGTISVSCTGITGDTVVTVTAAGYDANCLSPVDTIPFSLRQDSPSAQITFEAKSMACQYNPSDRTITWNFQANTEESISSQQTVVTITSPNSVTASFLNAPYTVTQGDSVTVILEISTTATVDITDVDADMTTNPSISSITDWNDNTIYSSGAQKTIQKSWTFSTSDLSPGTYHIYATVTSQNAVGDQASTTLTITPAEEEAQTTTGGATTGETGVTGGAIMAAGPTVSPEKNATSKPTLVPGIGLRENTKLQKAIEKVLGLANLSEQAKENLLRLSESITPHVEAKRNFRYSDGKSVIENHYTYKGKGKVKNFMIYEKIPKTFAESADNITVTAPGATIEVVERDPEYLFLYSEMSEGDEIVITYTVESEVDESVLNSLETELYAQSLEIPEQISQICKPGERRCSGNKLEECSPEGTEWKLIEICQYGCSENTCVKVPGAQPGMITIIIILIVIGITAGVIAYIIKSKREKIPSAAALKIGRF